MNVLFLKPLKYLKLDIGEPRRLNRSLKLLNVKTEQQKISMEINRQNIANILVTVKQSR